MVASITLHNLPRYQNHNYLISTLIDGFSLTEHNFTQETLSVAQIIMWNYRKSNKKVNDGQLIKHRHAKTHETPNFCICICISFISQLLQK